DDHVESPLDQALGEGARDLVERTQAPRDLRLLVAGPRRFTGLPLDPLVEPGVLDRDGELGDEGAKKGILALGQRAAALRVDGEEPDQLLAGAQQDADGGLDPDLLDR